MSAITAPEKVLARRSDTDNLMRESVALARSGDKRQARVLLAELLSIEPDHELGLLWAAALATSADSARAYLERLLLANPGHTRAAELLAQLPPPAKREMGPAAANKLILAVDDSQTVRAVISAILADYGFRVITATDGIQALARLDQSMPDLILLDVSMPRMDGYELCRVIKRNPYTRKIPVLILSGQDGFLSKLRGRLAGASGYLAKPLDEDLLVKAVRNCLPVDINIHARN